MWSLPLNMIRNSLWSLPLNMIRNSLSGNERSGWLSLSGARRGKAPYPQFWGNCDALKALTPGCTSRYVVANCPSPDSGRGQRIQLARLGRVPGDEITRLGGRRPTALRAGLFGLLLLFDFG